MGWGGTKPRQSNGATASQKTSFAVHKSSSKRAHIFLIKIPQENAVVLASTHHPLAFGICSDECRKKAEVLIDMPCIALHCGVVDCSIMEEPVHTCMYGV